MPLGHDVVAEAGVIGIFAILINTLYPKNVNILPIINYFPLGPLVNMFS
jgi:hypothetical protein